MKSWQPRLEALKYGKRGAMVYLKHTRARLKVPDETGVVPVLDKDELKILEEVEQKRAERRPAAV